MLQDIERPISIALRVVNRELCDSDRRLNLHFLYSSLKDWVVCWDGLTEFGCLHGNRDVRLDTVQVNGLLGCRQIASIGKP